MDLKAVIQESPCLWYSYSLNLKERQEYERILKETELWIIDVSSFYISSPFYFLWILLQKQPEKQPNGKKCFNFAGIGYSPTTG